MNWPMNWDAIFGGANLLALISWAALILLPRWPALLSALLYVVVGLLSLLYATILVGLMSGWMDPGGSMAGGNFSSIAGVQALFATKGGLTLGWVHYLAFDLFIGIWIARDADAKGISRLVQAPVLLATFMAGPLGLLVWLVLREPRARAGGRWR
ncbi:MAG TPA: ABA4-like family protein [Erythrobacter sp.]|nr:ABA4-like family protein [Erythrobacter sp.]